MPGDYPSRNEVFSPSGMNEEWRKWYSEMGSQRLPYRKYKTNTYSADATLKNSDIGKVIKVNNGVSKITLTLPKTGTNDIDSWVTIERLGTGKIVIQAPDDAEIENSGIGGRITCEEAVRAGANVTLLLYEAHKWAIIGGSGAWKVYSI